MSEYRIVPCPREDSPERVMIEHYAPDENAARAAGIFYAARSTWPLGWLPLSWHGSLEAAKRAALVHINRERGEVARHQAEIAAWSDIEILA